MPTQWKIQTIDGPVEWSIDHYELYPGTNIVSTFAVEFTDGWEQFTLAPRGHGSEVNKLIKAAIQTVGIGGGAKKGYEMGLAKGVRFGLTTGAIGMVVGYVAGRVAEDWFPDNIVEDGDYYASGGQLLRRGLIKV